MSYDIDLVDENGNRYQLDEPHHEGGTQPVCGWSETHINITWNYSWFYYHFLDHEKGIRWLYDRKASDCLPRLKACLLEFGTPFGSQGVEEDYWKPTPSNCMIPIRMLIEWCEKFPDGVFKGD